MPGTDIRPTGPIFPYRNQPFKTIYVIYLTFKIILLLPIWAFIFANEGWRQSPNWSRGRAIWMRLVRLMDSVMWQ